MKSVPLAQAFNYSDYRAIDRPMESAQSTGGTGEWQQLADAIKRLKTDGFTRYHARRQALFDVRCTFIGTLIYLATAFQIYKDQGFSNLAWLSPVIMSLLCLPPVFMYRWVPETYYKIRDWYFIVHFYYHHVYAPQELERLGVDLKQYIPPELHPIAFFAQSLMARTVVWQSLNVLMYRLRIKTFLYAQPFILAAVCPFELAVCTFLGQNHPKSTKDVYGTIGEYGRLLSATIHPVFRLFDQEKTSGGDSTLDSVIACRQVHLFLMIFFGYLIPSLIIWRLEKESWRDFISLNAQQAAWPGCPDSQVLTHALAVLKDDESEKSEGENSEVRFAVLVVILAAVLWRVVGYVPIVARP